MLTFEYPYDEDTRGRILQSLYEGVLLTVEHQASKRRCLMLYCVERQVCSIYLGDLMIHRTSPVEEGVPVNVLSDSLAKQPGAPEGALDVVEGYLGEGEGLVQIERAEQMANEPTPEQDKALGAANERLKWHEGRDIARVSAQALTTIILP